MRRVLEGDDSVLRDALEGFMDGLIPGEELDPDRIIELGRARRRRRTANNAAAGAATALVLLIAGGGFYALHGSGYGSGHGSANVPVGASGTSSVERGTTDPGTTGSTARALTAPPPGTLRGKVLASGRTGGVSWETSAALDGYANGNTLPQFCMYVWTSNGSTDPKTCVGPVQPDPPDPAAPAIAQSGSQVGKLPGTSLSYAAIYTSQVTTVTITLAGDVITLHPVTLAHDVSVTGIVMPASGGTLKGTGPGGTTTQTLSPELPASPGA